jgi:Holliday junction resolvasome RuvABC endonuclease subunit
MSALIFDQTLASSGWVAYVANGSGMDFARSGMILTPVSEDGHLGNLTRGATVHGEMDSLLYLWRPDIVVCEMPVVKQGRMKRTESSLLAAQALFIAARVHDVPVEMIGAQKAKKFLTGFTNADKNQVRAAVQERLPGIQDRLKPYNEHVVDALALGLTAINEGIIH